MAFKVGAVGVLGVVVAALAMLLMGVTHAEDAQKVYVPFNRTSFPAGFVFGAASAAYQYEGGAREGGRRPSIWDTFTHEHPDEITDRSNGDVAIDSYHRYKEDITFLKDMGMDAYRFSISWSRILPNGSLSGGINKEGVQYYNNVINDLLSKGLKPFVTIFHWDLPQGLESEYLGFLSPRIVDDYRDYAEVCFKEFGDRVKHWITLNEPWSFSQRGYSYGTFAPGRCSYFEPGHCKEGNSSTEPYIVGHHQLLAHAAAVKLYKEKYQASQKGVIGITLVTHWFLPYSNSKSDVEAAQRSIDFMFGWFMDPLTKGKYPYSMRTIVGDRLPKFTREQSEMVKGSFDFLGLNYYTTNYAISISFKAKVNVSYDSDSYANLTGVRNGVALGKQAASSWLYVYPKGLRDLLVYIKKKYNNPVIYITENGVDEANNPKLPLHEALKDELRIEYYRGHIQYVQKAIKEGVDVRGYFAWSLMDNFEWASGYTVRFGIVFIDYQNDLKRYAKSSYYWFQKFLLK